MPKLKTYRLFISHAWKYHDSYARLVNLLDEAPYFKWYNHSVPKTKPVVDPDTDVNEATLMKELREQVQSVHCVLVIAGMYATHRYWIGQEIGIFVDFGKPIIGIAPWEQEQIPRVVQDAAVEMVRWNTDTIVRAIRKHSL